MDDETAPAPRSPLRFVVPIVTLVLGGAAGHFGTRMFTAEAAAPEPTEDAPPIDVGSTVTNLGTFTINLRGSGGGRVLRVEVQLEGPAAEAETLATRSAAVRDTIITGISDYTWTELEGTDGKTRLRDELLARVNGASTPAVVERIYFTQFVVQ